MPRTDDLDLHLPDIIGGDAEAFGRWVSAVEATLRSGLRPFATRVDVEAVLQEALLRVWQIAPRFVSDEQPNGLLRLGKRIARNLAIAELRRLHRGKTEVDELVAIGDRAEVATHRSIGAKDPLLWRTIEGCRERLPEKPALALNERLTSAGNESDELLATRLGMRPNTFLQNFGRARRLLVECLERHGIDLRAELAR